MAFLKHRTFFLSACSGILLFCSFPNINLYPLAWIALIPLLVALNGVDNWKSAFWVGYIPGFIFFAGLLLAIALLYPYANIYVTLLGYILLVAYTALYFGVFTIAVYQLPWKSGILFHLSVAAIWVSLEWVRSWLLTGFPWGNLGYTQWKNPPAIQIASFTGVYGVSFVIIMFNFGIASVVSRMSQWRVELYASIPPILLAIFCIGYGYIIIPNDQNKSETSMEVGLVPGNIPQIDKWNPNKFNGIFQKYINLTRKAAVEEPDLIIWPETTVRGQVLSGEWKSHHILFKQMLNSIGGTPMLIGATDSDALGHIYNRVISVSAEGEILGKYAKMHLVPFGEYVPLNKYLPNIIQFKPFEHGKSAELLPISIDQGNDKFDSSVKLGTSICFESAFPNHFRQFVRKGANAMGILTNDAWFVGTSFPQLHLAMAPIRAVENRIAVFRCANGGYTCAIDSYGRITTSYVTPDNNEDYVIADIELSRGNLTIYTRYGDWFAILCFLVTLSLMSLRISQQLRE